MVKAPCYMCPDRSAECHAHCEKWLEYEKVRNAEYKRVGKLKEQTRIINEIEMDRAERLRPKRWKRNG